MGGVTRRVLGALLLSAAPLTAQARAPIETDRPDFTESSATIPKGRWQLETGRESVWEALVEFHDWPTWWPGLKSVEETAAGDEDGIGQSATSSWRGPLGYRCRHRIRGNTRNADHPHPYPYHLRPPRPVYRLTRGGYAQA